MPVVARVAPRQLLTLCLGIALGVAISVTLSDGHQVTHSGAVAVLPQCTTSESIAVPASGSAAELADCPCSSISCSPFPPATCSPAAPAACPSLPAAAPAASAATAGLDVVTMLRNSTTQCGRVFFDILHDPVVLRAVTHEECPDIMGSIADAASLSVPVPADIEEAPAAARPALGLRHFVPLRLPRCRLRWYTPTEACALIAAQGNLIMYGDSVVRGINLALHAILTNNYVFGAVGGVPHDDEDAITECSCDGAWGGAQVCHRSPPMASGWSQRMRTPQSLRMCPLWGLSNRLHYLNFEGGDIRERQLAELLDTSERGNTIYASEGFGWVYPKEGEDPAALSTQTAMQDSWSPLLAAVGNYSPTRLLVGTLMHPRGSMPQQAPDKLAAYNDWLRRLVSSSADLGLELLDGRQLGVGRFSRDGVHFGAHDNVAYAQVLLNVLDRPPSAPPRTRTALHAREREGLYHHGPLRQYQNQAGADTAQLDWLGEDVDLRGCRCFRDWRERLRVNASASVCHCRGPCKPHVTPELLTYGGGNCTAIGWAHDVDPPVAMCLFTCLYWENNGAGAWSGSGCGVGHLDGPCLRPVKRCAACGAPSPTEGGDVSAQGGSGACHPLCGKR